RVALWQRPRCFGDAGAVAVHTRSRDCRNPPLIAFRANARKRIRSNVGGGPAFRPAFQGKVNVNMAKSYLQSGVGGRIASVGAIAVPLLLAISFPVTVAPPKPQKKPADSKKPAAAQPSEPQSAWVKLCNKGPVTAKHKDGKEEQKELNVCMTKHERL